MLRLVVDIRFQVLFTPPGCFFTFPHGTMRHHRYQCFALRVSPASHDVRPAVLRTLPKLSLSTTGLSPPAAVMFQYASSRILSLPSPLPRLSFLNRFSFCPAPPAATGVSHLISFPPPSQMFQFTGFPPPVQDGRGKQVLLLPDCSIRISAGLRLLAAHRSFSQLIASFFG